MIWRRSAKRISVLHWTKWLCACSGRISESLDLRLKCTATWSLQFICWLDSETKTVDKWIVSHKICGRIGRYDRLSFRFYVLNGHFLGLRWHGWRLLRFLALVAIKILEFVLGSCMGRITTCLCGEFQGGSEPSDSTTSNVPGSSPW